MTEAISRDPIYRRRRYPPEVIELCVRWYITYRLSYRDLVAMMAERGVTVRDGRYLNNTVEQDHLLSRWRQPRRPLAETAVGRGAFRC